MRTGAPAELWPANVVSRQIAVRAVALACILAVTALTSAADDWQPIAFVFALGAALVAADAASVTTRRIRLSAGLLVQTTIMALLGPGPAVVAAAVSTLIESRINRVSVVATVNNLVIFSALGLFGGLLFELLRESLGVTREDTTYAVLIVPGYIVLAAVNLFLLVTAHPALARGTRLRVIRESALPSFPLELVNAMLAGVAVFVWARAGLGATVALVMVLAITIPLARIVADALKSGDDLQVLRRVSDERAAEVARLASDRERLLSEVMSAERRERARLAESLHDGPMQRLVALRQDALEAGADTRSLEETIAETRALISAFHPATVRELGFAASLRAAVAPFPAARGIDLIVECGADRELAGTLILPVAQELVVNAVKHAEPTTILVSVGRDDDQVVLEVTDDGLGIDEAQAARTAVQAGHVGLAMVRRRVEDAGGRLEIATRTDGGTHSRVVIAASVAFGTPS